MNDQSPITPSAATVSPFLSVVSTLAPLMGSTRSLSVLLTLTVALSGVGYSSHSGSAVGLGVTVGCGAAPSSVRRGLASFSTG